jgi:hypothetical protein
MPEITLKGLENTIEHYIKNEDFKSARNYVESFADRFKNFDKEKALSKIENAEKGIKEKPIKEDE